MEELTLKIVASKSIADKAVYTLKGILEGIQLDNDINEAEISELYAWCETYKSIALKNPFKEIVNTIQSTITGDKDKSEAIDDLVWLMQKYDSSFNYYGAITSELQLLQGICHGLVADGRLTDEEIFELDKWLDSNDHLSSYYPYDEIRTLVLTIVSDKKIDEDERILLLAYLNQFAKIETTEIKEKIKEKTHGVRINAICTSQPDVIFEGKNFCITGILSRCPRKDMEAKITALGGRCFSRVSSKIDYLIVGVDGNLAWAYSCYGRKVENALAMRKEGHLIQIIHEFDFCDIIDDLI